MRRIKLIVAYDGTNYHGWQVQPNGITIESELNRCLQELFQESIEVIGASRTDAGVHALCNVAVFDTNGKIPAEKIAYALNQRLPEDIRIQKSEEVERNFHPRHCQSKKTYEYRICVAPFPIPTKRFYSFYTYHELDIKRMKEGAHYLIGEHDFQSFCAARAQVESTIRELYSIEVKKEKEEVVIRVSGNGFLYNMVRIIAGTLMEVGQGKREPEEMLSLLNVRDRSKAGPTAPACGLTLVSYEFN